MLRSTRPFSTSNELANKDGIQLSEMDIDTIANVDVNTSSCPGAEEDSASHSKDNGDMAIEDRILAGLEASGP